LISGGFGTGKSHVLQYLQHLALTKNFMVSRVVVSKETPLHNLNKVFLAAVESAQLPGVTGSAVPELALRLHFNSRDYASFFTWSDRDSGISSLFPATLLLHERLRNDPELVEDVVAFWSGGTIPVRRVREGLREISQANAYVIRATSQRELALQRFPFLARLAMAAGYAGWVILIDELELIGRYTLVQRGRAYAELARWLGSVESEQVPGLMVVGAITDDFGLAVLEGKGDKLGLEPKLRAKATGDWILVAARAVTGMRLIEKVDLQLAAPDEQTLRNTYERLKEIHAASYDWQPPELQQTRYETSKAMRSYVRRWINEWDLARLFPGIVVETEEAELRPGYAEDVDLEVDTEGESIG
jgi:hypothetical protein